MPVAGPRPRQAAAMRTATAVALTSVAVNSAAATARRRYMTGMDCLRSIFSGSVRRKDAAVCVARTHNTR